jgi:parallel beta-helix repeat protein
MSSDPFILDQSTVAHTGSEGILGAMPNPPAVNAGTIIEANTFQNIGVALGPRYVRAAIGFNLTSNSKARIRHNVITGTAYIGIRAPGGSLVERNTITNFCLLADDCGGIYGGWGAEQGARIIDNFIATATANTEGKPVNRQAYVVAAIYLDDNAANFTVSGNIGAYTDYGFMLHNSNDNMLSGNTIFGFRSAGIKTQEDNVRRVWINGAWTNTLDSSGNTFPSMSNNIFQSNIFMSNAGVPNVLATSYLGGLSRLLSLYRGTGNTYINPFNTTQVVHTSSAGVSVGYTYGELVSSGLDSNPQHPFSAQAGSWPVRTEAPALINGTTTDFNSYTTYAPSGSVTKQSVSCPIASESGHCLLYEASSEASSLLVSRNFPVTQGQFYKIHLQVMSGDSSSWFGKAYVRRNGAPYESLNVYNPANSLHLQPAQWMTYNFYFKSNQTLANARIDLELPASGKMIIGAMTVSSVTLHSGDPNMLVQLLVNPDYLTNLAVPCPSGSNCSSWRTVTDTAVGFPVNLLSRQARPIVMGVSVVDVVAPAAPTSVSLTNVANLNLSWPAATDNVAVTGSRI